MNVDTKMTSAVPATNEKTAVAGVTHRGLDAVVGDHPGHDQGVDAEIAQDLVDRSGVEDARGALGGRRPSVVRSLRP